jgi:hypothetical protein
MPRRSARQRLGARRCAVVLFALLVGVTIVQHLYFRRHSTYELR